MPRTETPTGTVLADAILTKAGVVQYEASKLGLPFKGPVLINRTLESLSHPDTLKSLQSSTITLGHPEEREVTPENFKDVARGFVAGPPKLDGDGNIRAPILLGDRNLIDDVESGKRELSAGYKFRLKLAENPEISDFDTMGPLLSNHVALVEEGRAGPEVRVLDQKEEPDVTSEEIAKAVENGVAKGVEGAMAALGKERTGNDQVDAAVISKAVEAHVKPALDKLTTMIDEQDKAEAQKKAEQAKNEFEQEIRGQERSRFATATDALELIPEDKRSELAGMDEKAILVTALDGKIDDPASKDIGFLRGALAFAKQNASAGASGGSASGVSPYTELKGTDATARSDAAQKYVDAQAKAYREAGGV